ncbi:aldose 1-epimerase family protein [Acetobacteraceae bacterium H6797]|nr:aldose 1-epimerase family protein [Acetobacteraceae bacterium H6797]
MSDDRITLTGEGLSAAIKLTGAELCSLQDAEGREWLWQAGPAWPRHAPVLFPIVGKLKGDRLQAKGQDFRVTQHGFARDKRFTPSAQSASACTFTLQDDAETRALFPFAFRLIIGWKIEQGALVQTLTVENPGAEPLPFSLGLHPAFAWPLPGARDKAGHWLDFAQSEPAPIRRLDNGGLDEARPSPIAGNRLDLHDGLFAEDAIILDPVASRGLRFVGPEGQAMTVQWEGFPTLGIWSKPGGADFLCIEPWQGYASPVGWDGDFAAKPGTVTLAPGEARRFTARFSPR